VASNTLVAKITARVVKENVLAVLTDHAIHQPEEATAVAETEDQNGHEDGDHDQSQNAGHGPIDSQPSDEPAGRSPDDVADENRKPDELDADVGGCTEPASDTNAFPLSAVGYLTRVYGGEPRPAPVKEGIEQAQASLAWIYQTTLKEEQERRQALAAQYGCGYAIIVLAHASSALRGAGASGDCGQHCNDCMPFRT
jgi:hypothetical protein